MAYNRFVERFRMILRCKRLAALVVLVLVLGTAQPVFSVMQTTDGVWGSKPVLAQLLLDGRGKHALTQDLGFTRQEAEAVIEIARQEAQQIEQLEAESRTILANPLIGAAEKRAAIAESGYNVQIWGILDKDQSRLQKILGEAGYQRLVEWVERKWAAKQVASRPQGGNPETKSELSLDSFSLSLILAKSAARSFDVYATCYDAGSARSWRSRTSA